MNKITCKFTYECPKKWEELESTESDSIKFCLRCNHHVYLANNQQEFNLFSAEGKCVAIESEERLCLGMPEGNKYEFVTTENDGKGQ